MTQEMHQLISRIQHNCHISNARHAGNYSLCIYLLKMREYYRWEIGQQYNSSIDKEKLGNWLTEREAAWETLEQQNFMPLAIAGQNFDPFDSQAINLQLIPQNLVYSAGYGNKSHPHFFLGQLENSQFQDEYTIYITGKEYARDLDAPPAMAQGKTIYIRRESFQRLIWEKYEEWLWNKPDNAMKRAIAYYPFKTDVNQALNEMTDIELQMALYHEIGEIRASVQIGPQWQELLSQLPRSKGEIMFRAVKDHLADSLSTLPYLLDNFKPASLHFYMANLSSMRKVISPGLIGVYNQWLLDQSLEPLAEYLGIAKAHWLTLAEQMISLKERYPVNKEYTEKLASIIEQNHL